MAFTKIPGGVDRFRRQRSQLDEFFQLGDYKIRRRRHHRIEIPGGLAIDQVSTAVAFPCLDESEIHAKRTLENIFSAAKFADFFSFRDHRSHAGGRVEVWNARSRGADAFS